MSARKPARKKSQKPSAIAALLRSPTAARRTGWLLLWVLTFGGAAYGLHRLEPIAAQSLGDGSWRIEWTDTPIWFESIRPQIDAEAQRAAQTLESVPLHEEKLLEDIHSILRLSPWIADVEKLSKHANGLISVRARFRKPLTRVDVGNLGYLVDDEGHVLPGLTKVSARKPDEFIHLEDVAYAPPDLGQQWHGADVQAGLALIKFLATNAPKPLLIELHAVSDRVPRSGPKDRAGPLRIRTFHNNYILWGLPPGEEYDMEASATTKLERLTALFRQNNGRIPGDEIDIRAKDATVLNWPRALERE